MAGLIGGPLGSRLPTTTRLELTLPGLPTRPPHQSNRRITPHGIPTTPFMTTPSSIGGSGNPSIPPTPRPPDTIPPRPNASSPRSVINPLFGTSLACPSDGGANAS